MKIEVLWEEVVRRMPFDPEGKERGYYEAMETGFCLGLMLAPGIEVSLRMEALAMLEGIGGVRSAECGVRNGEGLVERAQAAVDGEEKRKGEWKTVILPRRKKL